MANDWLLRAIAVMALEPLDDESTRVRKAEAENANAHRFLNEFSQNARKARKGRKANPVVAGMALTQERMLGILEESRVVRIQQKKADIKANAIIKKAKPPNPNF